MMTKPIFHCRSKRTARHAGFSMIELVVAILLVGIIAAVAMSRMQRGDAFNALFARDQIISMARSAQQKAIGRSDVVLTLQPDGDVLLLILEADGMQVQRSSTPLASVSLRGQIGNVNALVPSCENTAGAQAISNSNPMILEFSALGDLRRGGVVGTPGFPRAVTTSARICINEDPTMSMCISRVGFAYVGDCEL